MLKTIEESFFVDAINFRKCVTIFINNEWPVVKYC